jgi:hypothetical protein
LFCTKCGEEFAQYNERINLCGNCYFIKGFRAQITQSSPFVANPREDFDVLNKINKQPIEYQLDKDIQRHKNGENVVGIGSRSTTKAWPQEKPMPNNSFKFEEELQKERAKRKKKEKKDTNSISTMGTRVPESSPEDLKKKPIHTMENFGQMGADKRPLLMRYLSGSCSNLDASQFSEAKARYFRGLASPTTMMPDKKVKKLPKKTLKLVKMGDKGKRVKQYIEKSDVNKCLSSLDKYQFNASASRKLGRGVFLASQTLLYQD